MAAISSNSRRSSSSDAAGGRSRLLFSLTAEGIAEKRSSTERAPTASSMAALSPPCMDVNLPIAAYSPISFLYCSGVSSSSSWDGWEGVILTSQPWP